MSAVWDQHPRSMSTTGQRLQQLQLVIHPSIHRSVRPSVRLSIFRLSVVVVAVSAGDMTRLAGWRAEVIEMRRGIHWPHQLSIKPTAPAATGAVGGGGALSHIGPALAVPVVRPCRRIFNACHDAFVKSRSRRRSTPSTSHSNTFLESADVIHETIKAYCALWFCEMYINNHRAAISDPFTSTSRPLVTTSVQQLWYD